MFMKRVLLLTGLYALCAVINPLSIVAEEELVAECDPDQTYPNNPPGPEGGCGDYDDCNENGAFDLGEPCREHHEDDGEHHEDDGEHHEDDGKRHEDDGERHEDDGDDPKGP